MMYPMSHATRWISNSLFIVMLIILVGACAGPQPRYEVDADAIESESRELVGAFEKVWRAVQLALAEYPIKVNNQDSGLIETELIPGDQGFRIPGQERKGAPTGRKYRIKVRVLKINKDHTQVVV